MVTSDRMNRPLAPASSQSSSRVSAAVGDLHCAGAARARGARSAARALLAAASDRPRSASDPRRDPRPGRLPPRVSVPRSPCGSFADGLRAAACRDIARLSPTWWRDLSPRLDGEPHSTARAGVRAGGGAARPTSSRCTRTSCTRPRRSLAMLRCCAGCRGAAPRTPRTSGRRPSGRSGRSSRIARGSRRAPRSTHAICAISRVRAALSTSITTASTRGDFRRRRSAKTAAMARMTIVRCASSRWVARSTRKASTTCSRHWLESAADLRWRLTHIGGGPMLRELKALARAARHRRSNRMARRAATGSRARRLPLRRHLRAALSRQRRRRPRRVAERAARSAEPEARRACRRASPAFPS